ncbi:MAG: hypothetical protein F6K65_19455 [Moorea sp. SIO3C2]|nr:hypothetical protein [Moorena sp. SIO3C2]
MGLTRLSRYGMKRWQSVAYGLSFRAYAMARRARQRRSHLMSLRDWPLATLKANALYRIFSLLPAPCSLLLDLVINT